MMRRQLLNALLMAGMLYTKAVPQPTLAQVIDQDDATHSASIAGRVLDATGKPVSEVEVYAEKSDFIMGKRPFAKSNKQGRFLIKVWAYGTYTVYVSKEEDGYAPTDSPFHYGSSVDAPQVTVNDQQPPQEVVIHLGPKAARLTGRIMDGATNDPVAWDAQITLRRVDNPDFMYATGPNLKGEFNVLVPSVPFTMKVSAPGYEDWYYRTEGSKQQSDALELAADTAKQIAVSLRPSK